MNQRHSVDEPDGQLCSYDIRFPADLGAKQVVAFVAALGGLLTSGPRRLFGVSAVVFELTVDERGIHYTAAIPPRLADFVLGQLRSLLPGVRVSPLRDGVTYAWTAAAEYKACRYVQTFRIPDAAQCAASLLASLSSVRRGECVMLQWVVTPALPERPPAAQQRQAVSWAELVGGRSVRAAAPARDVSLDQHAKLGEINVLCALRAAGVAASEDRARQLITGVQSVLSSVRGQHNAFRRRWLPGSLVAERIAERRIPLIFPIQLMASELVGLLAWPIDNPHVAGLPQARTRHLPATGAIPRIGKIVALSNFPGDERPLALAREESYKHLHIIGPTGVGKTVLLGNLVAQDMQAGGALMVMESKGDLIKAALSYVPSSRIDDVVLIDVTDTTSAVGYNVLSEGSPRAVVEEFCDLFDSLYGDSQGVWAREVLYYGLSTLVSVPGHYTFVDLAPLLNPTTPAEEGWRNELIAGVASKELRAFWERLRTKPAATQERIVQPVMDRIWQLNARPEIRNIIGQTRSTFSFSDVLTSRKILLINLAGLGPATASLAGTIFMSALWRVVKDSGGAHPIGLYLDEFQDFIRLPIDPADMYAKARSFKLAITAAHQHLGQLPNDLRDAISANARSKVVFQTTAKDARVFAQEFGRSVSETDFMTLGRFEVLMRLATREGVSAPVTGDTCPPLPTTDIVELVRARSRTHFSRSIEDIEADIEHRRAPKSSTRTPRPKIGRSSWN